MIIFKSKKKFFLIAIKSSAKLVEIEHNKKKF